MRCHRITGLKNFVLIRKNSLWALGRCQIFSNKPSITTKIYEYFSLKFVRIPGGIPAKILRKIETRIYSHVLFKIRILSKEIRWRLETHTSFFHGKAEFSYITEYMPQSQYPTTRNGLRNWNRYLVLSPWDVDLKSKWQDEGQRTQGCERRNEWMTKVSSERGAGGAEGSALQVCRVYFCKQRVFVGINED